MSLQLDKFVLQIIIVQTVFGVWAAGSYSLVIPGPCQIQGHTCLRVHEPNCKVQLKVEIIYEHTNQNPHPDIASHFNYESADNHVQFTQ